MATIKQKIIRVFGAIGTILLGALMFIFGRKSLGQGRSTESNRRGKDRDNIDLRPDFERQRNGIDRDRDVATEEAELIESTDTILGRERSRIADARKKIQSIIKRSKKRQN